MVVGMILLDELPDDSFAGTIAPEMEDGVALFSIQALDGVAQSPFRILLNMRWQWIVDPGWPAFFFENTQNGFLILGGPLELLHDSPVDPQYTSFWVP